MKWHTIAVRWRRRGLLFLWLLLQTLCLPREVVAQRGIRIPRLGLPESHYPEFRGAVPVERGLEPTRQYTGLVKPVVSLRAEIESTSNVLSAEFAYRPEALLAEIKSRMHSGCPELVRYIRRAFFAGNSQEVIRLLLYEALPDRPAVYRDALMSEWNAEREPDRQEPTWMVSSGVAVSGDRSAVIPSIRADSARAVGGNTPAFRQVFHQTSLPDAPAGTAARVERHPSPSILPLPMRGSGALTPDVMTGGKNLAGNGLPASRRSVGGRRAMPNVVYPPPQAASPACTKAGAMRCGVGGDGGADRVLRHGVGP